MVKTYVNSGELIEAYRTTTPLAARALAILTDLNRVFVTSDFVRLEVLPKPTYMRRAAEVAFYYAFFAYAFFAYAFFAVAKQPVPISRALIRRAMLHAETFGLSAVDALHVAAAERAGADELITTERPSSPLLRVTTLRVASIRP